MNNLNIASIRVSKQNKRLYKNRWKIVDYVNDLRKETLINNDNMFTKVDF